MRKVEDIQEEIHDAEEALLDAQEEAECGDDLETRLAAAWRFEDLQKKIARLRKELNK